MEKHILKQADFEEIFSEIVFFRNQNNSLVEIGYLEYGTSKFIKFYIINGEICGVEGRIFMNTFNKVQRLLTELDIKDMAN